MLLGQKPWDLVLEGLAALDLELLVKRVSQMWGPESCVQLVYGGTSPEDVTLWLYQGESW